MAIQKHTLIPDDARIFEGIRNRNKFFEDAFFIKYYDALLDYGQHKCNNDEKNQDIAQDLLQETIIITIENIRDGSLISNHEGHVLNWMKRTFSNQLSNWRRKRKKIHKVTDDAPIPEFLEEEAEKTPYPEILTQALEKLDKKCRDIIIAYYYGGMTMYELGEKFSYISSERNARQYKYRCMDKLKKKAEIILNNSSSKS